MCIVLAFRSHRLHRLLQTQLISRYSSGMLGSQRTLTLSVHGKSVLITANLLAPLHPVVKLQSYLKTATVCRDSSWAFCESAPAYVIRRIFRQALGKSNTHCSENLNHHKFGQQASSHYPAKRCTYTDSYTTSAI